MHPTIELAPGGDGDPLERPVKRVYFNERTRDSWRQLAMGGKDSRAATTGAFYDALRKFERMADNPDWHVNTPLKPGDVVLFDNARVMHSRNAFVGRRHMEGSYMSWDSIHATWRALKWRAVDHQPYEYCGRAVGTGSDGM